MDRTLRRLWLFWNDYEVPDNENLEVVADYSAVLRLPFVRAGQLVPFALLGAIVWWRRSGAVRLLVGAVILYCAGVVAFFVLSKLRVQIVPMLAVLAAGGVAALGEMARRREFWRLGVGAAVLAGGAALAVFRPAWIEAQHTRGLAISHNNLGTLFVEAGTIASAIDAYERAVATRPDSVVAAMRSLGELYLRRREYDKAERRMRRVIELRPGSPSGREALARLYQTMVRDDRYRDDLEVRRKLADADRGAG